MDSDPKERALEAMRQAVAAEKTPDLPWDAMEQRLFAKLDEEPAPASHTSSTSSASPTKESPRAARGKVIAFGLAAAAAVILGLSFGPKQGNDAPSTTAARWKAPDSIAFLPGSDAERDLNTLRPGDGVEAGEAPLTLVRPGIVRVTLAPHARAIVLVAPRDPNGALVLSLESGSLRAEVMPRKTTDALVETFAVDVGRTRIAAHGTAFRVIRGDGDVVVDLEHGSVAVGPVAEPGATTGRLLVGRARASFSLDGGQTAKMLTIEEPQTSAIPTAPPPLPQEPAAPIAIAPPPPTNPIPIERVAPPHVPRQPTLPAPVETDEAPAPPPPAPTPEPAPERQLSRTSVHAGLRSCFDSHYSSTDTAVRLSVSGTLVLSLDEEGTVSSVRFNPPLEPAFMSCVFGTLKPGHFTEKGPISVPFQLGR